MRSELKNLNLLFQGYVNTRPLWNHNSVFGLWQFDPKTNLVSPNSELLSPNLRLGKLVERFVNHVLSQNESIEIIKENIQIKKGKVTIGELDCLFAEHETIIHLEIIYKFYLYDPYHGNSELEHWIGPNRNDSLIEKLNKLKDKQLPLLFKNETLPVLRRLRIDPDNVEQRVHFKAQLFLPLHMNSDQIEILNKSCLTGYYISFDQVDVFSTCDFYIPSKLSWLSKIQKNVDWMSFSDFLQQVGHFIDQKRSPLCWIKYPNGKTQKIFVVWWK